MLTLLKKLFIYIVFCVIQCITEKKETHESKKKKSENYNELSI